MLQLVPTITLYTDKNIIRTKVNKVRKKIKAAVFLIGHFGIGKPMKTFDTQVVHVVTQRSKHAVSEYLPVLNLIVHI
jgi:sRNA-binding regulator protein Hfq